MTDLVFKPKDLEDRVLYAPAYTEFEDKTYNIKPKIDYLRCKWFKIKEHDMYKKIHNEGYLTFENLLGECYKCNGLIYRCKDTLGHIDTRKEGLFYDGKKI